jgi:hypothetical protein
MERGAAAEAELEAVQERAATLRQELERQQRDTATQIAHELEEAREKAAEIVSAAQTRAERVRAESDRELAAAAQRRDSINAQLTNVRRMLATLSGTAPVAVAADGQSDDGSAGTDQAQGPSDEALTAEGDQIDLTEAEAADALEADTSDDAAEDAADAEEDEPSDEAASEQAAEDDTTAAARR